MNICDLQDNKYYVAYVSRVDSKLGDQVRFSIIRIVGGFGHQKAKRLETAFNRESPSVGRVLGDGSRELLYWRALTGKRLKLMVKI